MRSTSRLSFVLSYRRAEVAGFWIVLTALLSLASAILAGALHAASPWGWSAAGAGILLPGLWWPQWYGNGVRTWNKVTRRSATGLRVLALRICHYCLVRPVSRAGSSVDLLLRDFESTRWIPRQHSDAREEAATARRWYQSMYALSRDEGNAWIVCLFPLIFLLVLLGDERQETTPPSVTYTLY